MSRRSTVWLATFAFALAALASVSPAAAWDCTVWHQYTNPTGVCYTVLPPPGRTSNYSKSDSAANASATATADSTAAATAIAPTVVEANNAGLTLNQQYSDPRQTPPAFAGTVQPTVPCANARNGGASSPYFGIALGFNTKDDECDLREAAREFYEMGERDLAVILLCQSKAARQHFPVGTCRPHDPKPLFMYPPGEREHRQEDRGWLKRDK